MLVRDINGGSGNSTPRHFTNVGGTLFFSALNPSFGVELWKSDGTSSGTVLVRNIEPSLSSDPAGLTNLNGRLVFSANDSVAGRELWVSDGTSSGTVRVTDLRSGPSGSYPQDLVNHNGTLVFSANDANFGTATARHPALSSYGISPTARSLPGRYT